MVAVEDDRISEVRAVLLVREPDAVEAGERWGQVRLRARSLVAAAAGQRRKRRARRPGALDQCDGDLVRRGQSVLSRKAGPQLRDFFERQRLEGDSNALDLAVEIAPGQRCGRGVADVVRAQNAVIVER